MRRTPWLVALLLAAVLPLSAAAPLEQTPPVPLLWKVSDRDNSLYLLGSFHMLRKDDYPLSKDVDDALADAESVLFELPPEEMLSKDVGIRMWQAALRTDGTTLADDLTPQMSKHFDAWTTKRAANLRKINMTSESLQLFEPWFVGLLVTIVEAQSRGFESELGLDARLAASAKEAKKPASGLENGEQQLAMLDGMDKTLQLQMLAESLDPAEDEGELDQLHRAWRAGDADTLWQGLAVETRAKYPALYQRINTDRNDAWVPKLEARLQAPGTDDTLVVVGALHLLGSDGVVEKLKLKGYRVERICSACK